MVTWTLFKNRLLEVGLTQNHLETMALRTLNTVSGLLQASALIGGKGGAVVQVRFTLRLRDQRSECVNAN